MLSVSRRPHHGQQSSGYRMFTLQTVHTVLTVRCYISKKINEHFCESNDNVFSIFQILQIWVCGGAVEIQSIRAEQGGWACVG